MYKKRQYGDNVYNTVSWHLYHYKDIKKAIYNTRLELSSKSGRPEIHSQNGYFSSPTEVQAILNLTPLNKVTLLTGEDVLYPERWISVIDSVVNNLDNCDYKIVKQVFYEKERWSKVIDDNYIDKNAFYRHKQKCLSLVAIKAAQNNLVKL